jgi:hypothetical protein
MEEMQQLIKACNTTKELNALYHAHPKYQQVLNHEFAARNEQLKNNIVNQSNFSPNGTANVQPN